MIKADTATVDHLKIKMDDCGKYGMVMQCRSNHDHLAYARAACDIWGCQKCSTHQERKYTRRLRPRLERALQTSARSLKFVTLTLPVFVAFNLETLEAYHKKAVSFLQKHYRGGLVVLEFSPRDEGTVFLHFHAIVQGGFHGQRSLQKAWTAWINTSFGGNHQRAIVHVRLVDLGGLNYILKYLIKGVSGYTSAEMLEIAAAFYKRQRLRSFGTLRIPVPAARLYARCPYCGASLGILSPVTTPEDLKIWKNAHLESVPPPEWVEWAEIAESLEDEDISLYQSSFDKWGM